jgi:hypothetical protein
MSEEDKINHTQLIVAHSTLLAKLDERSEHGQKQITALFDLLTRMDCKIDDLKTDMTKIKTERNMAVWICGSIAGFITSVIAAVVMKIVFK